MNKNTDFYKKKGNLNYRERTMLENIKKSIQSNPELADKITPASDFEELQKLHNELTSEVVEITEEVAQGNNTSMEKPFIDPLNREEPNVRDYVMDDKFDPFADFQKNNKSAYAEPKTYNQAFEFPSDEELRSAKTESENNQKQRIFNPGNQAPSTVNDNQKEKRKAKRFAKTIVDLVCGLLEVGFVWYATKDTNPNKLMEYELNNEMDLTALVELPGGVEATIKDYFLNQLGEIQVASKISDEKREGLTEDLTEVFLENNIQPNASINLAISGLSLLAEQGIKLNAIVTTNNQLLMQLRERKMNGVVNNYPPEPTNDYYSSPPPPPVEKYKTNSNPERIKKNRQPLDADILNEMDNSINDLSLLTETPTKE